MKFKNYIETESGIKDTSTSPGTAGQVLSSTVTGTSWIDPDTLEAAASKLVVISCKNVSGGQILKGTPVYQSGTVGATDVIEVEPADATISTGYLPAIGILQTTLNNNGFGNVVITGEFLNYSTADIPTDRPGGDPFTGDTVYLAAGGGLTCIKPTGAGNAIQNMGLIGKVSGGNSGSITVASIMRANDVPNLPEGRIWIGDGNTIVSDTVYVDEPNNRVGIGTDSPALQSNGTGLHINATTYSELKFTNNTTGSTAGDGTALVSSGNNFIINNREAGKITLGTSNFPRMIILSSGNVGIGTTSPVSKLQVEDDSPTLILNHNGPASASRCEISARNLGTNIGTINWNTGLAGSNSTWDHYNPGGATANSLRLDTFNGFTVSLSGSEKMRVNQAGNVGIGTANPTRKLHLVGVGNTSPSLAEGLLLTTSAGGGLDIYATSTDANPVWNFRTFGGEKISFSPNGSEVMRLDSTNKVGIGTTSPGEKLTINGNDNYVAAEHSSYKWGASNVIGGKLGVTSANGAAILDMRRWTGSGSNHGTAAITQTYINGAWGLDFKVGAKTTNTVSTVSRMFIKYDGNVGIGTTAPSYELDVVGDIRARGNGTGNIYSGTYGARLSNYYSFLTTNAEFRVGYASGTYATCRASAFTVTSDYRLKEKIVPLTDSLDRLGQLNVYKFNWIDKPNEEPVDGFIAHEVAEVIPEAVVGVKDEIGPDGKPEHQGLDQAKIVPLLTAALQDAIAKIEQLETRIQKLENK